MLEVGRDQAEVRQVEEEKSDREKGNYLRPDLYGQPSEKGILQQPVSGGSR